MVKVRGYEVGRRCPRGRQYNLEHTCFPPLLIIPRKYLSQKIPEPVVCIIYYVALQCPTFGPAIRLLTCPLYIFQTENSHHITITTLLALVYGRAGPKNNWKVRLGISKGWLPLSMDRIRVWKRRGTSNIKGIHLTNTRQS